MLTMASALDRCARVHGARRAIADSERDFTWREHLARVARAASVLASFGLAPGDRFGILSRNTFRHCELIHAGYWSGIVPVPVNVRLAPARDRRDPRRCRREGARVDEPFVALAADPAIAPFASNAFVMFGRSSGGLPAYETLIASAVAAPLRESVEDDTQFSCTPVAPPGARRVCALTQRNIAANGFQCISGSAASRPRTYICTVAPMFHSADLLGTGVTLVGGAHAYLAQFSPARLLGRFRTAG